MSSSTTSALSRQPRPRFSGTSPPPGSAGRAPQPVHGPIPGCDGGARRLPEPDGDMGARHRPDRRRPAVPRGGGGTGSSVGVDHPPGAAGPGPHRPQHPSEVMVLHTHRHHRRKNSHHGGRQDHARGPPGAGLGAAPPVGPGPRHGRRADPGPSSGQVHPEVPAIRELLEPLDLDGVVVTADAMHTQVDTAQWIRDQGGHYVLTVKGNQKTLRRTLKDLPWKKVPSVSSADTGHGRRVRRTARGRPGTQVGGLPRSGSGSPGPTYQDHQGQEAR